MAKYRKLPVVIDAVQFTRENCHDFDRGCRVRLWEGRTDKPYLLIETKEGTMRADVGDWIITGVMGEKYPCKPDIFDKTYEPVE